jgi:deoxyuridine 5'-triphosphate nucleotidohydrolase
MIEVMFTKTDERAQIPKNAYGNDAGWDLPVLNDTMIPEGSGVDVRTGIAVAIPDGYYGRIVARSSTMRKRGLMVLEGIIDAGFRGELFSFVYFPVGVNIGEQMVDHQMIKAGESVAQLIIQRVEPVYWSERRELPESDRGERGFGSSGN